MSETGFTLAPELAEIGIPLGNLPLSSVFLFDDARFPWLMLVPRRAHISEILDLSDVDRTQLFSEMMQAAEAVRSISKPDKLNIGALGNIVRQLHVHIIGRFQSDVAWPGPVWGHSPPKPYPAHMAGPLMDKYRTALGLTP
jgi:diadenosine tetraphosphate (Ap4A) HIT family hydrolase